MSSSPLSHHHRETIDRIFGHPTSGNIEWRQVRSLLETVGTVSEEHSGKIVRPGRSRPQDLARPARQGHR